VLGPGAPEPVTVNVYPDTVLPLSADGAPQLSTTWPPPAVAVNDDGADGAPIGDAIVVAALLDPTEFSAVTLNV
jgi:hypothetical protein